MLLADFLAVASISYLSRLALGILLTDTVLANEIWCASVGGVAEVAYTAKCAIALFWNVRVQDNRGQVGEARLVKLPSALTRVKGAEARNWRCKVLAPVEIAACAVGTTQHIFESGPCRILSSKRVDSCCSSFIQCGEVGVQLELYEHEAIIMSSGRLTQGMPLIFSAFP